MFFFLRKVLEHLRSRSNEKPLLRPPLPLFPVHFWRQTSSSFRNINRDRHRCVFERFSGLLGNTKRIRKEPIFISEMVARYFSHSASNALRRRRWWGPGTSFMRQRIFRMRLVAYKTGPFYMKAINIDHITERVNFFLLGEKTQQPKRSALYEADSLQLRCRENDG